MGRGWARAELQKTVIPRATPIAEWNALFRFMVPPAGCRSSGVAQTTGPPAPEVQEMQSLYRLWSA